ncbi:hypothetical protein BJ322DRAFT_1017959 [Thelephora terrestris]|uniref:Uncharacterized protein n=1 Tax=Thelephora terrestris TaxID=56493 RepID=A0A9P6LAF4_9AGAM|nr:hypothetical protein BJ322DRAFT_1017959 [Thelephora terrestris]
MHFTNSALPPHGLLLSCAEIVTLFSHVDEYTTPPWMRRTFRLDPIAWGPANQTLVSPSAMSSTRVPELTWFDIDDDIKRYGMEAQEAWSQMYPSQSIPPVDPTDGDWLWHGESSNDLDSDPFVPPAVFDGDHRMRPDPTPMPIPQTINDLQTLAPRMPPPPGTAEFHGAMPSDPRLFVLNVGDPLVSYPWKSPAAPRSETIPLPPVVPWYDNGGHFGGDGDNNEADYNFPDAGAGDHQEWTNTFAQVAGTSTGHCSLYFWAWLEPSRSEQSSEPTPSTSRSRYDRTKNEEGKRLRLSHIREALEIPSMQDELLTLQTCMSAFSGSRSATDACLLVIKHLRGNVPERETTQGWQTKPQRLAKKRLELRECFDELRNIVSPQDTKLGDLKVLNRGWWPEKLRGGEPASWRVSCLMKDRSTPVGSGCAMWRDVADLLYTQLLTRSTALWPLGTPATH